MQLHNCVFLRIKNNIHQKVRDIKDSIFNIFLFFIGLFSLQHGALIKVMINDIIKKTR